MADTNDSNTMVQLVTALHAHIIQEEAERRQNPEAWLATLTTTTQQQWAFVQRMRRERERREAQAHPAPHWGEGASRKTCASCVAQRG